jgi:hypothetical protein
MAGALSSLALSSTMGIGAASVPLIGCPRFLAAPEMEGQNRSKIRPAKSVDRPSVGDLRPRRVQAASKGLLGAGPFWGESGHRFPLWRCQLSWPYDALHRLGDGTGIPVMAPRVRRRVGGQVSPTETPAIQEEGLGSRSKAGTFIWEGMMEAPSEAVMQLAARQFNRRLLHCEDQKSGSILSMYLVRQSCSNMRYICPRLNS